MEIRYPPCPASSVELHTLDVKTVFDGLPDGHLYIAMKNVEHGHWRHVFDTHECKRVSLNPRTSVVPREGYFQLTK